MAKVIHKDSHIIPNMNLVTKGEITIHKKTKLTVLLITTVEH